MSAHRIPQTFITAIEDDPERLHAAVASIQFVHVTKFEASFPDARGQAIRHAEESLRRDIYMTAETHRALGEIETELLMETYEPGAAQRIKEAFEKIRALKMPELPEAKRHDVEKPVQAVRFLSGVLLSTHGPVTPRTDARVFIEIAPVFDKVGT
jgi:hypothetical protein